ncbi:MAG: hypothetical protein IKE42_17595 [Aquamicrobium sp.]|nr:hypothetical protein [Aquamicrobium sp.]
MSVTDIGVLGVRLATIFDTQGAVATVDRDRCIAVTATADVECLVSGAGAQNIQLRTGTGDDNSALGTTVTSDDDIVTDRDLGTAVDRQHRALCIQADDQVVGERTIARPRVTLADTVQQGIFRIRRRCRECLTDASQRHSRRQRNRDTCPTAAQNRGSQENFGPARCA